MWGRLHPETSNHVYHLVTSDGHQDDLSGQGRGGRGGGVAGVKTVHVATPIGQRDTLFTLEMEALRRVDYTSQVGLFLTL